VIADQCGDPLLRFRYAEDYATRARQDRQN
jgi:hypothetical protein